MAGARIAARAANNPVLRDLAAAAVGRLAERLGRPVSTDERQQLEAEIRNELAADPVVVNNVSAESPTSSRVVTGASGGTFAALSTFFAGLSALLGAFAGVGQSGAGFWLSLGMTLLGGAGTGSNLFALVGRLRDDLPPMRRRWFNPLSWLAGSAAP